MVLVGVAIALAFAVGIGVGESCAQPTEVESAECAPEVVEKERVVYRCEPDVGTPEPTSVAKKGSGSTEAKGTKSRAELPPAPPPITPKQRAQLLAWVRDQSKDLDGCRSAAKETYRLTVTLVLSDEGKVRRVRFNASELPSGVAACLRDRMVSWTPPADLIKGRPELVFGLTL